MDIKNQKLDLDELLLKYLAGEADQTERATARKWINASVENRRYFDQLKDIDNAVKASGSTNFYNTDLSWERVKSKYYKEMALKEKDVIRTENRIFIRDIMKYAAMIALLFTLGFVSLKYINKKEEKKLSEIWYTVESPYGSRVRLTLADGSKIWLNAGSNLRYSSLFGQTNRKVFLTGEAFFSVEKDSTKQFIVTTPHLDVKVYGTEFNVKAYNNEDNVQTTLVSGSITLEGDLVSRTGKQTVILEPNQVATYYISPRPTENNKTTDKADSLNQADNVKPGITPKINPEIYTSWKDPVWYIESEPLLSLTKKLERRFNIKFVFESGNLEGYKFTGTLKDETLEQVLNLVKYSAPIEYKIINNVVLLSENKFFKDSYNGRFRKEAN
jgi:ferric-dicitrate binding protein FerR (iron transport regulator)